MPRKKQPKRSPLRETLPDTVELPKSPSKQSYRVKWEIDIFWPEASNPIEAAAQALLIQRDPGSDAVVFDVDGKLVDLNDDFDPTSIQARADLERKETDELIIPLKLTRSEWCELANAVSSKVHHVKEGDYDVPEETFEDGFDPDAWAKELQGIYDKVAKVLDASGVVY